MAYQFSLTLSPCSGLSSLVAQSVKILPTMQGNPACNAGDLGLIPGLGRSPGGGHGNPLQYFCLENPMDRGAWRATVHGVARVGHDLGTKPPPPNPVRLGGPASRLRWKHRGFPLRGPGPDLVWMGWAGRRTLGSCKEERGAGLS